MQSWLRGHARLSPARRAPAGRHRAGAGTPARGGRRVRRRPGHRRAGRASSPRSPARSTGPRPPRRASTWPRWTRRWPRSPPPARSPSWRQVVHHYLARLDPDGPEPDPTEGRSLSIVKHADGGGRSGRVELDAVGGEKVEAVLESMLQANRPKGDLRTRRPAARRRLRAVGRQHPRRRGPADPAHRQAARDRHYRHRRLRRPRHRTRRGRAPASGPASPPPAPAGWPATATSAG